MKKTTITILLAAAATVAACGGGGGDDDAPADRVPDSASRSSDGLVDYLLALIDSDADRREPASLDRFEGPTPETTQPRELP